MRISKYVFLFGLLASPTLAQAPAGEGPALGLNRITQADITGGSLSLFDIRKKGMEIFSTPFNKYDGYGDGAIDPFNPDKTSPGNRPTLQNNSTFLRVNGLDTQACLECHAVGSSTKVPFTFAIGGHGGLAASAMPGSTEIDVDDSAGNDFAFYNGRLINPPFVFGAGGVELAAKEMTMDLQALKLTAQQNPDVPVALVTKGVSFGILVFDSQSQTFDTSLVEGIDDDLVVKPFGRKGDNATIRVFDLNALPFHQGMQPVETVGENIDADGDGVVNEILIGEVSALHIFSTAMERPNQRGGQGPEAQLGARVFDEIGCASCHVPILDTNSPILPISFPEVHTDPTANVFYSIDLSAAPPKFKKNSQGGVRVRLYSDLKRHDMGSELSESTGGPLDSQFITPRLWGVADSAPYMHDGRALSLTEAIEAHGGEGQFAADFFAQLTSTQKTNLLAFLRTLRVPVNPGQDLLD